MTRKEKAMEAFHAGHNCAQAVLIAFGDLTNLDEDLALRLSSSFGGGIGRQREVCGAVSGMCMAAGILFGYSDPQNPDAKMAHYARIQALCARFREQTGSIICRELLAPDDAASTTPKPEARTAGYYQKRPCAELVGLAAEILDEYIQSQDK